MKAFLQKITLSGVLFSVILLMLSNTSYAREEQDIQFSDAELAQMLAPIALYPDALLTHVLIATTYPLEVIEAQRWLAKQESLSKDELAEKSENLPWDASVKALLPFKSIVNKLSEDLTWMQNLGDAFLQDEENVIATIQVLRQQAEEAGSLAKMDNVQVVKEKQTIIIEPAETKVIYVPYYDTRVVYGDWRWRHYPPVYWNAPRYYGYHRGPFYWHSGVHIGFKFFFGGFHWHKRHIVVDYSYPRKHYPRKRISSSHHAKRWNHKPIHRRGVAYRNKRVKHKYASSQGSVVPRNKAYTRHQKNQRVDLGGRRITKKKNNHKVVNKKVITRTNKKTPVSTPSHRKTVKPRHDTFKRKLQKQTEKKQVNKSKTVVRNTPDYIPRRTNNERFAEKKKQGQSHVKHTKVPTNYKQNTRTVTKKTVTKHVAPKQKVHKQVTVKHRANTNTTPRNPKEQRNTHVKTKQYHKVQIKGHTSQRSHNTTRVKTTRQDKRRH